MEVFIVSTEIKFREPITIVAGVYDNIEEANAYKEKIDKDGRFQETLVKTFIVNEPFFSENTLKDQGEK